MIKLKLHWQILIALGAGVLFGIFCKNQVIYFSWMGDLFLRALKMIIVPLVLSSMISGVTSIGNFGSLGRIAGKTLAYYIFTSLFAIITGLVLVNIFKPGVGVSLNFSQSPTGITSASGSFMTTLYNIIPENIFKTASDNSQMLGLIFFALVFGYFINKLDEKNKTTLTGFFNAVFEVMMKITFFVIRFTPLGIFAIVATVVSQQTNLLAVLQGLGVYMFVVIFGISIHFFISLPLSIRLLSKVHPYRHMNAVKNVIFTAFSTSSSNATLPLTIEEVEKNCGVSNKISSFTLPLGATINMNGTALYECVAALFIAQAYGVDLSFTKQLIIVLISLLAAIGSAGIPMAGMVMMGIVLSAVGLPLEGIGLILSVDRLLDMFRTATNVFGDTCGAVIIASSEGEQLKV